MEERRCFKCQKIKPITDFPKNKTMHLGRAYQCKECQKKYLKDYYLKNRRTRLDKEKEYYNLHKDEINEWRRGYWKTDPERMRNHNRKSHSKLVLECLIHYGGNSPKCACCGESNLLFLTIDHINNNGAEDRRRIGIDAGKMYRWLRKNNYPEGFQVLCWNCNCGKARSHTKSRFCPVHHPE